MGVEDFVKQQEASPTCPHKAYCHGDCAECQGDELKASLNILKSRGR